jgi:hypothetical protein
MGQISDAITREYNSALERHQDSFSVGLKKVVDTFEKNKYIQISPENDPERRALTEAEEIAILRNEILRFLRSATGLASAGFAQKAEDERAIVDFLMAFFPKGLIEELMSEHLEWESKIRSVSKNHRATPGPRQTLEKKTATDSHKIAPRLGARIGKNFPQRFQELNNHHRSGHFLSGELSEVAERIWKLSQLWMIFLDGVDLAFTQDHDLYRHISDLANSHPRCTIEEEVGHWMTLLAGQMTDFEIALALWCGVDRVGSILVLNGNFSETLDELIQHRNRVNPAFRGK